MLPEISPGEMFLTYPSEFQMEFLHTDSEGHCKYKRSHA